METMTTTTLTTEAMIEGEAEEEEFNQNQKDQTWNREDRTATAPTVVSPSTYLWRRKCAPINRKMWLCRQ